MSFLRPAAVAAIRRWAEVGVAGAIVLLAGSTGIRWIARGDGAGWVALGAAALALFWLRAAVLSVLAQRPVTAAGLVVLREGEIGYMTPHGGGFLDLDALTQVEIHVVPGGPTPVWRLVGAPAALAIPATAEGAEHLPEALSALPGFSDMAAVRVLKTAPRGVHVIWRRPIRP